MEGLGGVWVLGLQWNRGGLVLLFRPVPPEKEVFENMFARSENKRANERGAGEFQRAGWLFYEHRLWRGTLGSSNNPVVHNSRWMMRRRKPKHS